MAMTRRRFASVRTTHAVGILLALLAMDVAFRASSSAQLNVPARGTRITLNNNKSEDPVVALTTTASQSPKVVSDSNDADPAIRALRSTSITTPTTPMTGPLCVFVPANAHNTEHVSELSSILPLWADASTLVFSEDLAQVSELFKNLSSFGDSAAARMASSVLLASASLDEWTEWQTKIIVASEKLRSRGATAASIRGRGQLSIPLFHWISQLVKRNDPLVQNCKWFMKCDTDTYLRRGLLEREVLNKLDHTKPYHVGVPLKFDTRPFHHTDRVIQFEYNIGGPGYTFSRGLMLSVDTEACVAAMREEPILLIHDDVATGYCTSFHSSSKEPSTAVAMPNAVASSWKSLLPILFRDSHQDGPAAIPQPHCARCVFSVHPVTPTIASLLLYSSMTRQHEPWELACATSNCSAFFMLGNPAAVGRAWKMDMELREFVMYWPSSGTLEGIPQSSRARAARVRSRLADFAKEEAKHQMRD